MNFAIRRKCVRFPLLQATNIGDIFADCSSAVDGRQRQQIKSIAVFKCRKCQLSFENYDECHTHQSEHSGIDLIDNITFELISGNNQSIIKQSTLKCSKCFAIFYENYLFQQHISHCGRIQILKSNNSNKQLLECEICHVKLKDETVLKEHVNRMHKIGMETCDLDRSCDKQFDLSNYVLCKKCPKFFQNNREYSRHMDDVHKKISKNILLNCIYCQEKFSPKQMLRHLYDSHQVQTKLAYGCKICSKLFYRLETLNIHNSVYHPNELERLQSNEMLSKWKVIINGSDAYLCDCCKRNYKDGKKFLTHYRCHILEKKFSCHFCNKKFHTKTQLATHIKVTHIRKHKCDICEKSFGSKQDYNSHRRTHTGERPFKCDICKRNFTAQNSLLTHKRILHTDLYLYKCEYCPKKFKTRIQSIQHVRQHTGESPFKCTICSKSFKARWRFTYHMKVTHSDNRPFSCHLCGASFKIKFFLTRHLKLHSSCEYINTRNRDTSVQISTENPIQDDLDQENLDNLIEEVFG